MKIMDHECGNCPGGMYSVDAVLLAMPYIAKEKPIPKCKTNANKLCKGISNALEFCPTVSKAVQYLMI